MVRASGIGLHEEQWDQLAEVARLRDTSVSHVVRRLLRTHLPGELAAARSAGPGDAAVAPSDESGLHNSTFKIE